MASGLAIFDSSMSPRLIQCWAGGILSIRTVVEVNAEESSVGKRIEVHEVSFALFDLFAFEG